MLSLGTTWRDYYLLLTAPGLLLAVGIHLLLRERGRPRATGFSSGALHGEMDDEPPEPIPWGSFLNLVLIGALTGFIYAALMQFMARYLSATGALSFLDEGLRSVLAAAGRSLPDTSALTGKYAATIVLVCGAFGQGIAGKLARPARLRPLMAVVLVLHVPCLWWMAVAEGQMRLWAACATGLVHFMNQPIYNSLIAQFVPYHRRSLGYGFSNMVCFGLGGLGPTFAGQMESDFANYASLAAIAVVATLLSLPLCRGKGGAD
jgi:hypothetical protein